MSEYSLDNDRPLVFPKILVDIALGYTDVGHNVTDVSSDTLALLLRSTKILLFMSGRCVVVMEVMRRLSNKRQ